MTDTYPPVSKALVSEALRCFPFSGMYQSIKYPMVGSLVKIKLRLTESTQKSHPGYILGHVDHHTLKEAFLCSPTDYVSSNTVSS